MGLLRGQPACALSSPPNSLAPMPAYSERDDRLEGRRQVTRHT
jgi:hypothetical protein